MPENEVTPEQQIDQKALYFLLNDLPLDGSNYEELDHLGSVEFSEKIVKIIENHDEIFTTSNGSDIPISTNLAIYGRWGSGKTSILNILQDSFNKQKYPVCFFNPWKYENKPINVSYALLKQIEQQILKPSKVQAKTLLHKGLSLAVAGANVTNFVDLKGSIELYKTLSEENEDTNTYNKWIDDIEEFSDAFKSVVGKVYNKTKNPIILIIDDLDRCTPDCALELIQNIKNYLNVPGCIFIMAIDREPIANHIAKKYEFDISYGYQYLEKIFQYEMKIPQNDNREKELVEKFYSLLGYEPEIFNDIFELINNQKVNIRNIKNIFKRLYLITMFTNKKIKTNLSLYFRFLLIYELSPAFEDEFNNYSIKDKISLIKYFNEDKYFVAGQENGISPNSKGLNASFLEYIKKSKTDKTLIIFIFNTFNSLKNHSKSNETGKIIDENQVNLFFKQLESTLNYS